MATPINPAAASKAPEFVIERYKYILQQIHTSNTTVYTFLGIYQVVATLLATSGVTLFVSYDRWGLSAETVRTALICVLLLITVVALFTCLLIVIGIMSWLDYRREEVALADRYFEVGFRSAPHTRNFWRWYETYIIAFVLGTVVAIWIIGARVFISSLG